MNTDNSFSSYRWVILALVVVCFCATFVTRFTWPPLITTVAPVLKLSMAQAGSYMSAFYIGYLVTQIPAGIIADKFGVRVVLAVSLMLEGVSTSSLAFTGNYETGFMLRIIAGLGAGAVYASAARALVEWFPARERGRAFGLLMVAPSAGILISNFLAPTLNQMVGWQGAFMSVGTITFVAGVFVALFMRSNAPRENEKGSLTAGFTFIFQHKNLMLTCVAGFCLMWLQLAVATWANVYIKSIGFTVKEAGAVMMWYGVGGVLSPIVAGFLSDRLNNRRVIVLVSLALTIPLTLWFGYETSLTALYILSFSAAFASYLANPMLNVMVANYAGVQWAATASGIANFLYQIASLISPLVLGLVIDWTGNFSWVWWIMALGPAAGFIVMLGIKEEQT